jgi:excisionase family DNA binding protein
MTFNGISDRQAVEMLGVEIQFVSKLVRQGRIRAHGLSSNTVRMDRAELEAYLARTCTTARTQR